MQAIVAKVSAASAFSTAGGILAAIVVFGVIILVHEFGHFIMARLCGVRVLEFAIGMGPKLIQWGKGETKYTLRLLLVIGGFCAMEGEDAAGGGFSSQKDGESQDTGGEAEAPDVPADSSRSLLAKKVWQRMLIMVAGALMNLVLGFVLLVGMFAFCLSPTKGSRDGKDHYLLGTTSIVLDNPESAAYQAGLRDGDTVLRIDGRRMMTQLDIGFTIANKSSGIFEMTVRRQEDGKTVTKTLKDVPVAPRELGIYGKDRTFGGVFIQAAKTEYSVGVMIWRVLGDIVTGNFGLNELSGPVGTIGAIGDSVQQAAKAPDLRDGLYDLLMLVVMITVNVGIFNLLPFPGLDGGRFLFLVVEGVTRRKVPPKYEGIIHAVGLGLLLLLMLAVTFGDIRRLITGG